MATDLAVEVAALSRKINEAPIEGFEVREKRRLSQLEHFYRRMANLPLCAKDRERVDAVMAEYVHAIKNGEHQT